MHVLLCLRMGAHSVPVVLGRRTDAPRAQRLCEQCNQHAVGDGRHMVFERPALQCVRDKYAALCAWSLQHVTVHVAGTGGYHSSWCYTFHQDCFAVLDAPV